MVRAIKHAFEAERDTAGPNSVAGSQIGLGEWSGIGRYDCDQGMAVIFRERKPFKVLGISQYFLPLITPRAVRLGVLSRYTQNSGLINWTILCASPMTLTYPAHPEMMAILSSGTRVLRTPCLGGRGSRHLKWITGRPRKYLMLRLPDARVGWMPSAVRCARKELKTGSYEIMQSFSTPPTSHLVAGLARLKHRLPWVAFFSDPWSGRHEIEKGNKGILNRFLEKWIFESADVLAFPSSHGAIWTLTNYPERIRRKAVILPHCFDPDLYPSHNNPATSLRRKNKMRLLYAGTVFGPETPAPLFAAIDLLGQQEPAAVTDLEVVLLGTEPESVRREIRKYNLEGTVRTSPRVPYLSCLALLQEADVLLLLDPPLDVNLLFPSKLVDYLGAGKPILALTQERGPAVEILRPLNQPAIPQRETDLIARQLKEFLRAWREGSLAERRPRPEAVKRFSVEAVSKKLMDVYKRVSGAE